MCVREWLAIYTGVSALATGTMLWLFIRAVYRPHPTLRSAETIRLLTDCVLRLKEENKRLASERSEFETTVFTLSAQVAQLRSSLRSEPLR